MTQSRMRSLSKPSSPSLCALRTVRENRCFFPSLLPPASQPCAAARPAGCPAGNKVAFCRAARCYSCPCSGPGCPTPCPWLCSAPVAGAALSSRLSVCPAVALLSQAAASSPCWVWGDGPGRPQQHLQSKQPRVNKHANHSVREGKRGASPELSGRHLPGLEPAPWPPRGAGALLRCGRSLRAGQLKRESPSPRLCPARGVSGPQGAREPRSSQGRGPAWSGTRPPVTAPGAGCAARGDCGQCWVPCGAGSPQGLSWQ